MHIFLTTIKSCEKRNHKRVMVAIDISEIVGKFSFRFAFSLLVVISTLFLRRSAVANAISPVNSLDLVALGRSWMVCTVWNLLHR